MRAIKKTLQLFFSIYSDNFSLQSYMFRSLQFCILIKVKYTVCFHCFVSNQCIYFPPSSIKISAYEGNKVTRALDCTARPIAAWQTEAQRDRARKSDQINRAPRDKRENIETSSAASDLR